MQEEAPGSTPPPRAVPPGVPSRATSQTFPAGSTDPARAAQRKEAAGREKPCLPPNSKVRSTARQPMPQLRQVAPAAQGGQLASQPTSPFPARWTAWASTPRHAIIPCSRPRRPHADTGPHADWRSPLRRTSCSGRHGGLLPAPQLLLPGPPAPPAPSLLSLTGTASNRAGCSHLPSRRPAARHSGSTIATHCHGCGHEGDLTAAAASFLLTTSLSAALWQTQTAR